MQNPVQITTPLVTLRWGKHAAKEYPVPGEADVLSLRWSYVVWKRRRWRNDEKLIARLAKQAVVDLGKFGITTSDLREIAECDVVEVGLPDQHRDLCFLPWEFLLVAATRVSRAGRKLLVIRRLLELVTPNAAPQNEGSDKPAGLPLLFVQSAPGRLRGQYMFDTEYKLVRRALHLRANGSSELLHIVDTPTLEKLKTEVVQRRPVVVHLSGVDSREGGIDLDSANCKGWPEPGFYLQARPRDEALPINQKGVSGEPCDDPSLGAADLAPHTEAPEWPATGRELGEAFGSIPTLVSVYCRHSTSLAADIISGGARLAIGFQDEVDDPLVELFFANFYRDLLVDGVVPDDRVLRNFWQASEAMRREKEENGEPGIKLRGAGIVLWTREALPLKRLRESEDHESWERRATVPALHEGGARSILGFDIRPYSALNYSLLHNDRSLFKRFVIKTDMEGTVFDLRVLVNLDVAGTRHSYSTALDLQDFYANLSRIRVSLTSDLLRSLHENVYSAVQVRVECQGQLVHENTHRVLILPINEWKDDQLNGAWLPSFVLPNDPAITKITRVAKKYLQALTDDPLAGFDGYQRVQGDNCDSVHKQVQAIWNALLHDFRLSYINPPPAFEKQSQRIRTPTQVLAQERGTCIDMALMLAACLEYADIYPAIFLLSGHAFVGYFSSTAAHDTFGELFQSYFQVPVRWKERGGKPPQPWLLERDARRDILDLVSKGGLVPLETTHLCQDRGFFEAAQQGRKNLSDPIRFEAAFDVKRARENQVVPLPIGGEK